MPAPSPTTTKTQLRLQMRRRRLALCAAQPEAGSQLCANFVECYDGFIQQLRTRGITSPCCVAGFCAAGGEIDALPVMMELATRGYALALPVIGDENEAAGLGFRAFSVGDSLTIGAHGILEPMATALLVQPDVFLVPMLACDRQYNRLGRGGGHYDRTLADARAARPVLAVGLAFAAQEIKQVPVLPHDQKLDMIVTEREMF